MNIKLNAYEEKDYKLILDRIPTLSKGQHIFFRDFFKVYDRTASDRVARKLHEDVAGGIITDLMPAGRKSNDGYIKV